MIGMWNMWRAEALSVHIRYLVLDMDLIISSMIRNDLERSVTRLTFILTLTIIIIVTRQINRLRGLTMCCVGSSSRKVAPQLRRQLHNLDSRKEKEKKQTMARASPEPVFLVVGDLVRGSEAQIAPMEVRSRDLSG
jgi:hypothetical protein